MWSSQGKLLPDANSICRRADDHFLSLSRVFTPVEGKLTHHLCNKSIHLNNGGAFSHEAVPSYWSFQTISMSTLFRTLRMFSTTWILLLAYAYALTFAAALPDHVNMGQVAIAPTSQFCIVVYICVWKRPRLTRFVLKHFAAVRDELASSGPSLDLYVVGSDPAETAEHAIAVGAAHAIHPNNPVGRKHNRGLRSIRDHFERLVREGRRDRVPDAVAVFGSDDAANSAYFRLVKKLMSGHENGGFRKHVVGVQDIYFSDVLSRKLVYTAGYKTFATPLAGTVGCGRAFSWSMLDAVDWRLWDDDRDRGLDQSAVRNIMERMSLVAEVSESFVGREQGVAIVDVKSDGFGNGGRNVWSFKSVLESGRGQGRLKQFTEEPRNESLTRAFGARFVQHLEQLRATMIDDESLSKSRQGIRRVL